MSITRRAFVAGSAAALQARESVRREVFLRSPAPGTAVMREAYYTNASGGDDVDRASLQPLDTIYVSYDRYSNDYGEPWSLRRASYRRTRLRACYAGIPELLRGPEHRPLDRVLGRRSPAPR